MSSLSEGRSYRLSLPCKLNKFIGRFLEMSLFVMVFLVSNIDAVHAMGGQPAGNGAAGPEGPAAMLQSFLPLILIFVIFYFLLIRPQSKKAKEHKQVLENLKKGDKVITTGGIFGIIEDIDTATVTLKVGVKDDVRIKVGRGYIAGLRTGEQK